MDTTVGADPLVGQVLDERYRIESRIARGGMATVYVARDLKLGREIAVKVMHAGMAQDEDFVRRFMGEAKAAALLSHPNVVAVFDQGTSGQHVYLVMEYIPGRTLRDLLSERGRLGPRQALAVMQQVLAALGAAHRAGLVHRDVKPENVLLGESGQIKVADFGLARAESASKQTKTGLIIGTVAYMAPEQVLSGDSDARTDVYAAGIMLFELLTGIQPHRGESPLAVAYKHVNDVVPLPSSLLPGIPPQLDALVAAATAHDPARRPADAARLLAAVAEVERTLPPDIDQSLAHASPIEPHNATAVMQLPTIPPPAPPSQHGYGAPQYGPTHHHTTAFPSGMLDEPRTRHRGGDEESSAMNRILSAFTGRFVLIGVGLIALIVLGWAVWYQTNGQYEKVPNVVGEPFKAAQTELESKGYKVLQGPGKFSDKAPKGSVAASDPSPGDRIAQGNLVRLFPSLGRKPIPIPDVHGKSVSDAQNMLAKLEINATVTNQPSTDVPRDQVIGTDPAAGNTVVPGPGGPTVTILVSTGISVPNVVGKSPDEAKQILSNLGFNVNVNTQDAQQGQPQNTVISEDPPAGQPANKGDTITLIATKQDCGFNLGPIHWGCPSNNQGTNPQDQNLPVPNELGQSFQDARQALRDAGFRVKGQPNVTGHVLGQNPLGGTAPRGSEVQIW